MKLKTSTLNKSIFLNLIKRFGWIGILYFIIMFLAIPIGIIYISSNYEIGLTQKNTHLIQKIFEFKSPFVFFTTISIPVFMGIMLFRYNQTKNISDTIHSLPIRRESLFISNIVVGLLLIILPVLIIALISIIILYSLGLSNILYLVTYWIVGTIVFSIIFFSVSVFCGMITGISTLQGILTYILLFLPYGLSKLIVFNLKNLVYGFTYENILEQKLIRLSPITKMIKDNTNNILTLKEITIYFIVSVVVILISYYLYKLRKTEAANQSITFNIIKPIFKYGITLSSMLLAGLYYSETKDSFLWLIFSYIIGSLLGYFISEMIIKKSFYVFKSIKGYVIYSIVIIIMLTAIHFDITGVESYIPNEEDIESVSVQHYLYDMDTEIKDSLGRPLNHFQGWKSKPNIEAIRKLHKEMSNKRIYKNYDGETLKSYLVYKLKSGKYLYRQYNVPMDELDKYIISKMESVEYKKRYHSIFEFKVSEITEICIYLNKINPNADYKTQRDNAIIITNKNDLVELKLIIENEIINEKYEDIIKKDRVSLGIVIKNINGDIDENIASDIALKKWLNEKGYLE